MVHRKGRTRRTHERDPAGSARDFRRAGSVFSSGAPALPSPPVRSSLLAWPSMAVFRMPMCRGAVGEPQEPPAARCTGPQLGGEELCQHPEGAQAQGVAPSPVRLRAG